MTNQERLRVLELLLSEFRGRWLTEKDPGLKWGIEIIGKDIKSKIEQLKTVEESEVVRVIKAFDLNTDT